MNTQNQISEEAKSIINNNTVIDNLCYLKSRWHDESEYEDFNEYKETMQKIVEKEGYKFIKMSKTYALTLEGKYSNYLLKFNGKYLTISRDIK